MTPNHGYNTPEAGTLDWHVPLNENFEKLDTKSEIRDSEANLGQYTPKNGAKFLATDTGRRYLGDGTEWSEAPPHYPNVLGVPQVKSDPTDAVNGQLWYREDTGELKVKLASGVTALTDASSTDTGSDTGTGDTTQDGIGTGGTLEVVPAINASWGDYEIRIDGNVTGQDNTESGDVVTTQSDGTTVIEGGAMYKDGEREVYEIDGTVLCATLGIDGHLELNGQKINPPQCQ
jgi:hypothetical protein